ncbi:MAG: CCA tRNA nucleotidyltransferase [Dehalococcoidales bacterium]|nr:CCA tRNA nucleotidyltransferase [Dehalococcoidales bacterium]NLE90110.1 CCA tRNA nucleotidyltransferase [Dehalococcoidales bacterium]
MESSDRANIISRLSSSLPGEILHLLNQAGTYCTRRGERLYIAGGMVRDLLLGLPGKDIDLVVEGDSHSLTLEIADHFPSKITLHERFRTAKLSIKGFTVDIAAARKELYTHPGALPLVQAGTLKDDLKRRDFTINAMAVVISGEEYGQLIDPLGGLTDLKAGVIRILHPVSFRDDPTRIFRAIRYEQRFGFKIEPGTLVLIEEYKKFIRSLSPDRLRYEFECIFNEQNPEEILIRAFRLSVLAEIFTGLLVDEITIQWFKTAKGNHPGQTVPASLYLSLLFCRLNSSDTQTAINRLNLPNDMAKIVFDTCKLMKIQEGLNKTELKQSEICHLLTNLHPLAIEAGAITSSNPIVKERLKLYLTKLRYIKPILSGEDLIKLGYSPDAAIGRALLNIKEGRLNGIISTREEEILLAKNLLKNNECTDKQT